MKKCRKCGYELEKGARKCIRCGHEFKVRHCRICGCKLETNHEFDAKQCYMCAKSESQDTPRFKKKKWANRAKVINIIEWLSIVASLLCALYYTLVFIYNVHPAIRYIPYDIEIAFKSRDKIIENSVEVDPTKFERDLNAYKGQYIKVEGQVFSLHREREWTEVYLDMTPTDNGPDGYGLMIVIVRQEGDFDGILENDNMIVHGIGIKWGTYTTIRGIQKSVPIMYAVDYTIN